MPLQDNDGDAQCELELGLLHGMGLIRLLSAGVCLDIRRTI